MPREMSPEEQAVVEAAVEWDDIDLARDRISVSEVDAIVRRLMDAISALHAASGGRWTPPE